MGCGEWRGEGRGGAIGARWGGEVAEVASRRRRLHEQVVPAGAVAVERAVGVAELAVVVHEEHGQGVDVVPVAQEARL